MGLELRKFPGQLIPEEKQERRKEKVTFPPSDDVSGCIAWVWRTPCPGLPRTFRMRARKVPGHQNSLRPGQPGMAGHPFHGPCHRWNEICSDSGLRSPERERWSVSVDQSHRQDVGQTKPDAKSQCCTCLVCEVQEQANLTCGGQNPQNSSCLWVG